MRKQNSPLIINAGKYLSEIELQALSDKFEDLPLPFDKRDVFCGIIQKLIEESKSFVSLQEIYIDAEIIFSDRFGGRAYQNFECGKRTYYYWLHEIIKN